MGARVIITPGFVSPAQFSHPLLATLRVAPQPVTAVQPKSDVTTVQQKTLNSEANAAPLAPEAKAELRETTWHEDNARPAAEVLDARTAPPTHTADASSTLPGSASMSDAAAVNDFSRSEAQPADSNIKAPAQDEIKSERGKPQEASKEAGSAGPLPAPAPKTAIEKSAEKPADVQPASAAPGATDNQPPGDIGSPPIPKADPATLIKRSGQIAIFISRKDSKLYVRQNFSPLFELPVAIAADERPLGTHIFTAQVDRSDANVLHWSVVSLPAAIRLAERIHENQRLARGHKLAKPIEVKAPPLPDNPAEALNRVNLPAETMARLFEAMSTGASIIVSDQGIGAGETGEGTDFIVSLR